MSLLERRKKKNLAIPKLRPDSPGYYSDSPLNSPEDFNSQTIRESQEFGDIKVKSNGDIEFSESYPVVRLSDLKFEEQLGGGVQGTVYRVIHIPSGKEFAVKSIKLQDKSQIQKTVDEIHSLRVLKHPNVVNMFSAFFQKGFIHILMDLVKGASLGDYIKFVPIIPEPALNVITDQLIKGLLYIRKQHILHRDLKPSNIMVSREGVVKVADFGLSKQLRETGDFTASITGTTCYMSPERVRGLSYGLTSDVWSVGVILYQCCIGCFPWGGKQANFWDIDFEQQSDFNVSLGPHYSPELVNFIERCLIIDPDKRATFEELSEHNWITQGGGPGAMDALLAWIKLADDRRNKELDAQRRSREALFG